MRRIGLIIFGAAALAASHAPAQIVTIEDCRKFVDEKLRLECFEKLARRPQPVRPVQPASPTQGRPASEPPAPVPARASAPTPERARAPASPPVRLSVHVRRTTKHVRHARHTLRRHKRH
jgi:hypothetical protein